MGSCLDKKKDLQYQIQVQNSVQNLNQLMTLDKYCQDPNSLNTYNLILSNVKVKLKELRICKVTFDIAGFSTYESPISNSQNGRHVFQTEFQTSIQITEENLRKSNLEILVKDLKNEVISNIVINLYEVATGPNHFDYDFQLNQVVPYYFNHQSKVNLSGKLSFDLKMAQIVQIQLQAGKVICTMNGNLIKQAYRYSMKLVTYTHTFLSEYSDVFVNPAYLPQYLKESSPLDLALEDYVQENQVQKQSTVKSSQHSMTGSTRKISKAQAVMFNDHLTQKNFKQLKWENEDGVCLDIEVPINQIPASSLQLCFWAVHVAESDYNQEIQTAKKKTPNQTTKIQKNIDNEESPTLRRDQEDYIQVCETYISLNQIFKHEQDEKFELEDGVRVYQYVVTVEKGLWYHGQQEGMMTCEFHIKVPAYLYQPIVGVRTNKSIQQASSVINESQISVKEISELAKHLSKMTDSVFKLQFNLKDLSGLERMNLREILNSKIHDIIVLLQQSHKESIMSFYYKSQSELFKAQDILLQLAHHLITTADNLDDSTRERYYLMLMLIMNRGELALNQMGFTENTQKTSQKFFKLKLDVGLSYQNFLYTTLKLVLEKLKQKAYSVNERIFIESFCARAFFQIPEFRSRFSACLVQADDPPLIEWRGTQFDLEVEKKEYYNKDLTDLFDWQINFYSYLDGEC